MALIHPFTERQYSKYAHAASPLSAQLREVTPWWIAHVQNEGERSIATAPRMPIVIYADASGTGHLSAIVYTDGEVRTAHAHIPECVASASAGIV